MEVVANLGGGIMLLGFIASAWQWIIILAIVLLLFGNRLPMVARSLGRSLTEFKKGVKEVGDEEREELEQIEEERQRLDERERAAREREQVVR